MLFLIIVDEGNLGANLRFYTRLLFTLDYLYNDRGGQYFRNYNYQ